MAAAARKISIEGDRVGVPASALDHAGFRSWVTSDAFPERLRASFIDSEVLLEMSPEALDTHNQVKLAITMTLARLVAEEDLGRIFMDGMLITNERAGLSTEPDVAFASWATLESGRLRRVTRAKPDAVELAGTPDLVVEIVSDSSVRKDTKLLPAAYARAGVAEYWLIDARHETVRFEILRLAPGRRAYLASRSARGGHSSAVFGRRFALTRRRDRLGGWAYELTATRRAR